MKFLSLFFCLGAALQAQTPSDSQLLLNEVRLLRQDLASVSLSVQRTQILLYRLQLQESALTRATQRLDRARDTFNGIQERRKSFAEQLEHIQSELNSTQDATQKARIPQIIAGLKTEIENLSVQEQEAQARQIEAESQLRTEQAKHDALESSLDKLDKQLENLTVR